MNKIFGWSKRVQSIQLMRTFFMDKPKQSDSWACKCILKNQSQFRKCIRWKVGDGTNIDLWLDNWCTNESLATLMGVTYTSSFVKSIKVSHNDNEWDIAKL